MMTVIIIIISIIIIVLAYEDCGDHWHHNYWKDSFRRWKIEVIGSYSSVMITMII